MTYDVIVPTAGRESLGALLNALGAGPGPLPQSVIIVDDRPAARASQPLPLGEPPAQLAERIELVRGPGRGPAAARNAGWRRASSDWIAFLDDDVLPARDWRESFANDVSPLSSRVAASQGQILVPLLGVRQPTDWERNTAGLESARWATADMAYRRDALCAVGGFDERFPRAYREDADLALRVLDADYEIKRGRRAVLHPVRPAGPLVSLRVQAGNADDALMRAKHGPNWRQRAGAPRGRLRRHALVTAAGGAALLALAGRRRATAAGCAALWLAGTAELAWARIARGPRTRAEVGAMVLTSLLIPPAASWHRLRGEVACRRRSALPEAVLLDRDGTLIVDVPYNGDPDRVRPMPGAREAVERLRSAGVPLAVVSNQSGVGRGLIGEHELNAVNQRVEQLLGPLGPWLVCPHAPEDGCECRKPQPGLVLAAAERLGVKADRCVLIGDIGADIEAARAAGARAVLVPTAHTRPEEVAAASLTATTLGDAVEMALGSPAKRKTRT
jgi:histidinol-phosphate phosphatase family protein